MIQAIVELLFYTCCGWIGRIAVKLLTLGKVDLKYEDTDNGTMAECVVLFLALGIFAIIHQALPISGRDAFPTRLAGWTERIALTFRKKVPCSIHSIRLYGFSFRHSLEKGFEIRASSLRSLFAQIVQCHQR